MVTSRESSYMYENVARMPDWSDDTLSIETDHDTSGIQSLYARPVYPQSLKHARHIPSNSRNRFQKYCLPNSPRLCSPHRKQISMEEYAMHSLPLAPPPLSNNLNLKPAPRPSLPRLSSRKLHRRTRSRDGTLTVPLSLGKDANIYRNEADFLIKNQHHFTKDDFEAVLSALAEESKADQILKQQEEESLLLAHELASDDFEQYEAKRSATSESEDLEAIIVALREELIEKEMERKNEEESYRLACQMVSDDVKSCNVQPVDHGPSWDGFYNKEEKKVESTSKLFAACTVGRCESMEDDSLLQCQACHLDIENEEMIRELPCRHHFHAYCINRWFLMNKKVCPYCRTLVKLNRI